MAIGSFEYDRRAVRVGIAHIGVGNFHRAHQHHYLDRLLEYGDQREWGVCGIALLPSDRPVVEALRGQGGIYTLTEYGSAGDAAVRRIGSLTELLWAPENPSAVIEKLADPDIRIISLTITEGGYNIDAASGRFDLTAPDIIHDLHHRETPVTVFGYIAGGLRRRRERGGGPVTILSCDNLQHNGRTTSRAVSTFIGEQDGDLARWVVRNVSFPNSMVDRITPAVTRDDVRRLGKAGGTGDAAPVYCERFAQWVIEDSFAAGRPALERVGVEFTDDVAVYENMKISLLNASHTMLSYPAILAGYTTVDQAVGDKRLVRYLRTFMDRDMGPYVPPPPGTDLEVYKDTLIARFGNPATCDRLARLCYDGASKIPTFLTPKIIKMAADGADMKRIAFFAASYRTFLAELHSGCTSFGVTLSDADRKVEFTDDPVGLLHQPPLAPAELYRNARFADRYLEYIARIEAEGVLAVVESVL